MVTENKKRKYLKLKEEIIEQVPKFVHLGSVLTEEGLSEEDIIRRIGLTSAAFGKLQNILKDKEI